METDKHTIALGDVYKYECDNNQGYGYMIPVKTSAGWDFIDTYHLDIPWTNKGEIAVDASIRRINELGRGEHDGFVRERAFNFYNKNVQYDAQEVPSDLRFVFNLNDYEPLPHRDYSDYDDDDTIMFVPLYREQNFDWGSGTTLGLCFVRKGAEKSQINEFRNFLNEANSSIIKPYAEKASFILEEVEKKLHELENNGLSTPQDELEFDFLVRQTEIINKCAEDLREAFKDHLTQLRNSVSIDKEEKGNKID